MTAHPAPPHLLQSFASHGREHREQNSHRDPSATPSKIAATAISWRAERVLPRFERNWSLLVKDSRCISAGIQSERSSASTTIISEQPPHLLHVAFSLESR